MSGALVIEVLLFLIATPPGGDGGDPDAGVRDAGDATAAGDAIKAGSATDVKDAGSAAVEGRAAAPSPPRAPAAGAFAAPPAPPARPAPSNAARGHRYETVVVAPPREARAPREDPAAAATVIFPAESPRARDDLGDLLAEVPGVTVTRSGGVGDFATVTLRGSNPDEVRIYIDGVPLNLAAGGGIDISTIPIGDVERIEIYRGVTPLGFPESAMGGVISIITRAPGQQQLSLRAGAGSFSTLFADASAGSRAGPFSVYAGLHALRGRDGFRYRSDNGTTANPLDDYDTDRANNQLAQLDGVLRATLQLTGRRQLGLGLIAVARDHGLPGAAIQTTRQSHFETARGIAYGSYESRDDLGDGGRLAARLFLSAARDRFIDPIPEIGGIPALTRDTTVSAGSSLEASQAFGSWLRGGAIFEARRETFQPTNELDAHPIGAPAERRVGVAGGELDLWWRRLDLDIIPSARIEAIRDVVTGRDLLFGRQVVTATPISRALPVLRLGLVRRLSERVTLKANGGRYARAPSFLELYGDNGQLLGNPALRPESGLNGDAGASYRLAGDAGALEGHSTVFVALAQDLIEWQPSSASGPARVGNVDRARIWGVEQDLSLRAGRHARLLAQGTYLDARNDGAILARRGHQLPLRPRYRAYARPELRHLFDRHGLSGGAYVEADLRVGTFFDPANIQAQPSRLLLGAGVTVDLPSAGVRVALSAKNLTDSRTPDFSYYALPGRSVFLSLMWSSHLRDDL